MANSPKDNIERMERTLNGWKTLAPEKKLGGMKVEEYEVFVNNSRNPRATLETLDDQTKAASALRDANDVIGLAKTQLVKNGVLADEELGEDSALYEAMGYVKKSDKKSGLTRKKKIAGGSQ
jgi:hypothetical protein